jgi:hypothetical protein
MRSGVSRSQADTLLEWASEYGIKGLDHTGVKEAAHWIGGPHIKIRGYHIKVWQ